MCLFRCHLCLLIAFQGDSYVLGAKASRSSEVVVVKRLARDTKEYEILRRCQQLNAPNVIRLIETIEFTDGLFIIMPKLCVLEHALLGNDELPKRLHRMSFDLARGVAFLHIHGIAHLDLRPLNVGFDQDYSLQIFDFGLSEEVSSEDDLVTGARGHPDYMAPEQKDGPFSPLLADRWSCGQIFQDMSIRVHDDAQKLALRSFSKKLKAVKPTWRPSLDEWISSVNVRPSQFPLHLASPHSVQQDLQMED